MKKNKALEILDTTFEKLDEMLDEEREKKKRGKQPRQSVRDWRQEDLPSSDET